MNQDTAEAIMQLAAERVMTDMYLISAESIYGINLRRFVEATRPSEALEIWKRAIGYYDADPKHVIDLDAVDVILVPTACGHPGVIDVEEAL